MISWIWLLAGVTGMVLFSPLVVGAIATVKYWQSHRSNDAALVSAWGRLFVRGCLFLKGVIFFGLGLIGISQPGPQPWVTTATQAGLTLIPVLLIILAIRIAHDERAIIAAEPPRGS